MTIALQKVKSGDPLRIPAATFNAMIDTARDHQQRQQGREQTSFQAFRQREQALGPGFPKGHHNSGYHQLRTR